MNTWCLDHGRHVSKQDVHAQQMHVGGVGGTALYDKTCSDEQHMFHAEVALHRAEGQSLSSYFPACRALEEHQP